MDYIAFYNFCYQLNQLLFYFLVDIVPLLNSFNLFLRNIFNKNYLLKYEKK